MKITKLYIYEIGYFIVVAVYFRGFLACPPRYFVTILYIIIIIIIVVILILLFLHVFLYVNIFSYTSSTL